MALVETSGLHFRYGRHATADRAHIPWILEDINLTIEKSSTLGIVGESGSGKSTLVRLLCGLLRVGTGSIEFDGRDLDDWRAKDAAGFRRQNQIIFQSPASSLDPRMRVGRALSEPVRAIEKRAPSDDEIVGWLKQVGLGGEVLPRFPHQLSGGQLQRIGIARALSLDPSVLYADEPTSSLDVSVQAQVLNLLMDLQDRLGLTLVMVSHDLAVISRMCEEIVVLKDGRVVEAGRTADVMRNPSEAYTAELVGAAKAVSLAEGVKL
ncbi:MAG: ABC transporter ATP-binding protein [Nitriliruptoraceae bacterium]